MTKRTEHDGVRVGQEVLDVQGKRLGRVTTLFDWGFEVARGFPILFRQSWVVRYDEVRGLRDGALVVARSDDDLLTLAAGGVPPSWRIPAPPSFPNIATPPEARGVFRAIAEQPPPGPVPEPPPEGAAALAASRGESLEGADAPLHAADEREYEVSRGQELRAPPPHP